jgi:hypothetical protein
MYLSIYSENAPLLNLIYNIFSIIYISNIIYFFYNSEINVFSY